jgi:antitoxin VapB
MSAARKVSLFRNGANQAVRIPKEFELPYGEATMRQEGNALILEPITKKTLLQVLASLEPLNEGLPDFDDAPPEAVEL